MTQQKGIRCRDGFGFKEQLMKKRDIYIRLRLVCAVYTMVFAIVTTMATFLTEYAWVRELTFEVPEVLVFTALGITFRLRDFRRYENIEIIVPREKSVVMFLPYPDMYWPKRQKIAVAIPLQPVEDSTCDDEDKALLKDSWVMQSGHAKREAHTKASIKAYPRLLNQLVIFDQLDSEAKISESRACLEMGKTLQESPSYKLPRFLLYVQSNWALLWCGYLGHWLSVTVMFSHDRACSSKCFTLNAQGYPSDWLTPATKVNERAEVMNSQFEKAKENNEILNSRTNLTSVKSPYLTPLWEK